MFERKSSKSRVSMSSGLKASDSPLPAGEILLTDFGGSTPFDSNLEFGGIGCQAVTVSLEYHF